ETVISWASDTPSHYLASKLIWDATTDVDALLEEFYTKFFGPAAAPMKPYIEAIDHALRHADHHTGSSSDLPHIYNEEVRSTARRAIDDSLKLAKTPEHQARVAAYAKSWEFFEQFARMIESRQNHDYVTSKEALDNARALQEELRQQSTPL